MSRPLPVALWIKNAVTCVSPGGNPADPVSAKAEGGLLLPREHAILC